MNIGAVVLDTNTLKHLEDPDVLRRVRASLATAQLHARISAVNVLEIVTTQNLRVRDRLLRVVGEFVQERWLVPDVSHMLRFAAEAELRGEQHFSAGASGFEWMVKEPERIADSHVQQAVRILGDRDDFWERSHQAMRKWIRPELKRRFGGDPWGSVGTFLDRNWTREDQLDTFAETVWSSLELPGEPPLRALLSNEIWRMYFEAHGAVIYERVVPSQVERPAHISDVVQLVYLAGARRRILVTEDAAFVRAARGVLEGRYPNSRVMLPADFIASAG
jgi:hypothetical protein